MPKRFRARHPFGVTEERRVRNLAASRHAPGDWIRRARMIAPRSGRRTRRARVDRSVRDGRAQRVVDGLLQRHRAPRHPGGGECCLAEARTRGGHGLV